MRLILLGPPGAGKGTQAVRIAQATGLAHISTGDMFRENMRSGTELGLAARQYIDHGELVPDEVTIGMLLERLDQPDAAAGILLDGFPRTVEQAHALDDALAASGEHVHQALLIDVTAQVVRDRLAGRWSCPQDGSVYHEVNNPPKNVGKCDLDGEILIQREDDTPDAINRRLAVYDEQTAPLIAYYKAANKLVRIDGERSAKQVGDALLAAIGAEVP